MTKGLPASGKSTWARKYQEENPNTIRINKDDLRAMLHNSVHSKGREAFILDTRDFLIEKGLQAGHDVIVDDTNLNPIHQTRLEELAKQHKADFLIEDFTHINVQECIKRDAERVKSVGKKVIMSIHNEYLNTDKSDRNAQIEPYIPGLNNCYIFDIDGTLAIMGDRSPYDWKNVGVDTLNMAVFLVYKRLKESIQTGTDILIISGRDETCRTETENWLRKYAIDWTKGLFMRPAGDMRKDSEIKREIYEREIKGKYNVLGIFDDRNQVVEMWRGLGLPCFQVAEGDF